MPDEKVKKAVRTVQVSPLLQIDSPMVMWFVEDLEGLEATGLEAPGATSRGRGGSTGEPDPIALHVAVCNAFSHPADMPGALENGVWMGAAHEQFLHAQIDAGAHEDGNAQVFLSVGNALIGPVRQG